MTTATEFGYPTIQYFTERGQSLGHRSFRRVDHLAQFISTLGARRRLDGKSFVCGDRVYRLFNITLREIEASQATWYTRQVWHLSGATYQHRHTIARLPGAWWNRNQEVWVVPCDMAVKGHIDVLAAQGVVVTIPFED